MSVVNPVKYGLFSRRMLLCALLICATRQARSADNDALLEALTPKLDELAQVTAEADWAEATTKAELAGLLGFPWPLPVTRISRDRLASEIRGLARSVPEVPDDKTLVAMLNDESPCLSVGDLVSFWPTAPDGDRKVEGRLTAIRVARELAGGGRLEAYIEVDGRSVWTRKRLPDDIGCRAFPDEREEWMRKAVPLLRDRLQSRRQAELAAIPRRAEDLCVRNGYFWLSVPGTHEKLLLTEAAADQLLEALGRWVRANKNRFYQHEVERDENSVAASDEGAGEVERDENSVAAYKGVRRDDLTTKVLDRQKETAKRLQRQAADSAMRPVAQGQTPTLSQRESQLLARRMGRTRNGGTGKVWTSFDAYPMAAEDKEFVIDRMRAEAGYVPDHTLHH